MIDRGAVLTVVVMVVAIAATSRLVKPTTLGEERVLDAATTPLLIGVFAARIVAMMLDDPTGLTRPTDVLIIRGGLEFWPGVAVGAVVTAFVARRRAVPFVPRLADMAPYALVAYAAYEGACLVREGCFGPITSFGLRPAGITTHQVPVGVGMALAAGLVAWPVTRLRRARPADAVLLALGGIAVIRTVAAFWLPKLGAGPTRQHVQSIVVLVAVGAVGIARVLKGRAYSDAV